MANNFFKYWSRGKPLTSLKENSTSLTYWSFGQPVQTFAKPSTPVTNVTVLPDPVSLVLTPLAVTVNTVYNLQIEIDAPLHLVFGLIGPRGAQDEIKVEATGATVIYNKQPGIQVETTGAAVIYRSSPGVFVEATGVTVIWKVSGDITAEPDTAHLIFSMPSPTIVGQKNVVVDAPLVSLIITPLEPNVGTGVYITDPLHLVISPVTPTISCGVVVSPSTIHLYLSLKLIFGVRVSVQTLHLYVLKHNPTIPQPVIATPGTVHLVLTLHEPNVGTGAYITDPAHLIITPLAPQIITNAILSPEVLHLLFTLHDPFITISSTFLPDPLHLIISPIDPLIGTGAHIEEVIHLIITPVEPTIITYQVLTPEPLHLIITPHDPGVGPSALYVSDLLHKERDWAAHFTHTNAEYADRSGTSLSANFPANPGYPNFTICLWFRVKSLPAVGETSRRTILTKENCFTLGLNQNWLVLDMYYKNFLGQNVYDECVLFLEEFDLRISLDRWYHLGVSVETVSGKIYARLWDDFQREIVASRDYHSPIFDVHPPYNLEIGDLTVGNDPTITGTFFDGYIDELVFFNAIRSPQEIDAIRQGKYVGQLQGYTLSETGLYTGYNVEYEVKVEACAGVIGYNQDPTRKVESAGLMVGYLIPAPPVIPPPPVIGGLAGGGAGEGSVDFCHLSYKFKTDVYAHDYNSDSEGRFDNFTYPTQHLEASLGSSDQGAYFHMMSVFRSGANIFSAPIWALRTSITDNAMAGQTVIQATDVSNLYVNEKAILMRANSTEIFDLVTIAGITGNTVYITEPLEHHYHPFRMPTVTKRYDVRSSYLAPCMTGIVEVEDHGLKGPRPFYYVKVKVDGGVWTSADMNPEVQAFHEVPLSSAYVAPRIERTVVGTDDGIHDLMPHFTTSRFAFEVEWTFIDSTWQDLRALFFATKGRVHPFYMPTWVFELTVLSDALAGATQIQLHSDFVDVYTRFSRIFVVSGRNANQFVVNLTGSLGNGIYTCEPLSYDINQGDRACFYPQVRFLEDELIFEFLDIGKCAVKVSFIEVLS